MRLTPGNRRGWRDWLAEHHDSEQEIWLVFYKKHTGKPTLSYNDAVEEAVCFGWIDGVRRSIDAERYMHRFTPRTAKSRWSPTNRKRARRMIAAGLMTAAGLKRIDQAKRSGTWEQESAAPAVDTSMPRELEARLSSNKKAAAFFESLAPSYRAQFTGWINIAKRDDTRRRRVEEALALLERGEKLGMK